MYCFCFGAENKFICGLWKAHFLANSFECFTRLFSLCSYQLLLSFNSVKVLLAQVRIMFSLFFMPIPSLQPEALLFVNQVTEWCPPLRRPRPGCLLEGLLPVPLGLALSGFMRQDSLIRNILLCLPSLSTEGLRHLVQNLPRDSHCVGSSPGSQ